MKKQSKKSMVGLFDQFCLSADEWKRIKKLLDEYMKAENRLLKKERRKANAAGIEIGEKYT